MLLHDLVCIIGSHACKQQRCLIITVLKLLLLLQANRLPIAKFAVRRSEGRIIIIRRNNPSENVVSSVILTYCLSISTSLQKKNEMPPRSYCYCTILVKSHVCKRRSICNSTFERHLVFRACNCSAYCRNRIILARSKERIEGGKFWPILAYYFLIIFLTCRTRRTASGVLLLIIIRQYSSRSWNQNADLDVGVLSFYNGLDVL